MNIISSSQQWQPLCEPLSKPKLLKSCFKSCVTFVGHRNFWAAATFILMAGEISPFCHLLSLNSFCQGRRLYCSFNGLLHSC